MRKITLLMAAFVAISFGFLQAQTTPDYILGTQTPWTWTAGTVGTQVSTGVYQWKFTATATADVFFKFGETAAVTDGSGFWVNNSGGDLTYNGAGSMWDAYYQANSASGGAVKFAATTGYSYVIQSRKASANTNANFAVFESPSAIATISTVSQAFATGNLTVTVTASVAPSAVQKFWVRYTLDNWATSQFAEATGSGTTYTKDIPLTDGQLLEYYVFTTVQAPVGFTDYSFYTVSYSVFYKYMKPMTALSGDYYIPKVEGFNGFNSLGEAIYALSFSGMSSNVNLYISANLTENTNVSLGVNTGTYLLTIKPKAGVTPTITFTDGLTAQSIDGHFVIGSPNALNTNLVPTNNIIIDGSNTVDGTTKDLTINGPVTTAQRSVFRIYGNNDNITIKNCTITNNSSNSSTTAPINVTDATTTAPDNLTILNNTLVSNSGNGGIGVQISVTGTPTVLMTGIKVQNNIITARATRAILFNYVINGEISGNTITHDCQLVATAAASIAVMTGGSGVAGTFDIFNNRIIKAKTWNTTNATSASVGIIAIDNQLAAPKIVNIYNNFITGFEIASTGVNSVKIYGIRHIGGSTSNIYHNTIVMPEMTNMTSMTNSYIAAIAFATGASTEAAPSGTMNVKNNIIVSNETTMKCWGIRRVGTTGTFTSNNNVVYAATANNLIGFYNASDATDLAAWKLASSQDANSISKEIEFVSASDLRLTATSVDDAELGVAKLTGVVDNDILGTPRAATTYMGAHEASNLTLPAPTKIFTVTVPNGTSKVYIAGTFTGKKWNLTTPHELTPTANPNEFTGTFACANDVAYKYLCEKGDFDYQAAVSAGGAAESNRSYNAADPAVVAWLNMKTVTLNVTFATVAPSKLFVKGSWDSFTTPIELVKTGNTFSTVLSGILANKIPNSTEYKYYTDQEVAVNWESNADNSLKSNRWTIMPVMNDIVARFTTEIISGVNNVVIEARIMRTYSGIEVAVDGESTIELYNMNGVIIDKTRTNGTYSRDLNNGVYIIRINGKATKFVK